MSTRVAVAGLLWAVAACARPPDALTVDAGSAGDAATVDALLIDAVTEDASTSDAPLADATSDTPDASPIADSAVADGTPVLDAIACHTADASALPAPGTTFTLSHNTGPDPALDVHMFRVTPDSTRVVFRGDTELDGVVRLYTAPIGGGAITTLSQNVGADTALGVFNFEISPDGTRIVFIGDPEVDGVVRLYSVPIGGGPITTLSQNSGTDPQVSVYSFRISLDSSRVVYMGPAEVAGVYRLYSVPITGGTPVVLSPNTGPDPERDVRDYAISDDSQWVVFTGDTEIDEVNRLCSVPIDGGALHILSPNTQADPALWVNDVWQISADSTTVVFAGDLEVDDIERVYAAPIGGGPVTTLSINGSNATWLDAFRPMVSPDSAWVIYRGDQLVDGVYELYSTPIGGGPTQILSTGLTVAHDTTVEIDIAPNSSAVAFVGFDASGIRRVYSVPIGGGMWHLLSPNAGNNVNLSASRPRFTPDSTRIVFVGDAVFNDVEQLYSNCVAGGDAIVLSANTDPDNNLDVNSAGLWALAADGNHVFYRGDVLEDDALQLFRVDLGGGPSEQIDQNVAGDPDLDVESESIVSPDGAWIVFRGDTETDDVTRLYSRALP